ncbi:MgtC/SapB family protein [Thermaurantiacus sp.]
MERFPDLVPLALSLAIGLLVGLERGWSARGAEAGTRVAGFRTFGLLGLLGGLAALAPVPIAAVILGAGAALVVAGYARAAAEPHARSATSAIAGLLVLGLGWFAASGHPVEALASAAMMTMVLALRHQLHDLLRGMTAAEVEAVGRFAIVALVILPLMPDRAMGPLDAWNPRQLWFVVVLVSGLSFAGYVAARRMGPEKGLMTAAGAGALVSSTAVTAAYARRLARAGPVAPALAAGISIASVVMLARVMVLTGLLARSALPSLAMILVPALLVQAGLALWLVRRARQSGKVGDLELGNPLDFAPAIGLAAFLAGLALLSRWLLEHHGGAGIGFLLTLTGIADVDAAIITLSQLPPGAVAPHAAGLLLALPVLVNSLWKAGIVMALGGVRAGWPAAWPLVASVAVAGVALVALAFGRSGA